jgi:hypothetical protein
MTAVRANLPGLAVRGGMLAALTALAACGPIPLAEAERQCVERARLAQQPRGELAVGVGSGGRTSTELSFEVTSDFIAGNDPAAVYDSCVRQRAGQPPSRPLSAQPGWTGR